ncbi:MAG: phosphate signaling complex protein PhoU [Eubacteriales bacterium]|nr:phosphate signaling complex protein PhoU [Eubacteriales bacterium]
MRNRFEEQLLRLHNEMLEMGGLCEEVITCAIKALFDFDTINTEPDCDRAKEKANCFKTITEKVFFTDKQIDQKERDIESLCLRLLLHQQPVASDLRKISSALKMISDMERIGDQSSDIAEIVQYIEGSRLLYMVPLREMSYAAAGMVNKSIEAYIKNDALMARDVIGSDDIVDGYFADIRKTLIAEIANGKADGEACIDILMIAKYFERIGDHATNIAEWVEYSVTGTHGKY